MGLQYMNYSFSEPQAGEVSLYIISLQKKKFESSEVKHKYMAEYKQIYTPSS